jgi:predicted DNA-binding protein (MmcQ/YjbR family)
MNIEECRDFCLSFPHTEECLPFDDRTLVFKVLGKMFALFDIEHFVSITLKCEPQKAILLREQYPDIVKAGYHANKKHWNTVSTITNTLPDALLEEWIKHSFEQVVNSMPKKLRNEFI